MAGDAETGVCIMQMEAGLDTGPVLLRWTLPIDPEDTTGTLHDKLASLGADAIVETLVKRDTLTPEPQSEVGVTYAAKIDKAEARIDWHQNAEDIDRQIRGLSPFPGAWFDVNGTRIKALNSEVVLAGNGSPGEILASDVTIACGSGAVRLTRLQRAGKGAQDVATFLRGFELPVGANLAET